MADEKSSADERKKQHDDAMERCHRNVNAAKNDNSGRIYRIYADGVFDMGSLFFALLLLLD